jgi:RNA ligase (TIGR02306 family)
MSDIKRKLASIRKITKIESIPSRDRIVLAEVDYGFKCVVGKDEFNVGDLCVYFEVDAIIPFKEPFLSIFDDAYNKPKNLTTEDSIDSVVGLRIKARKFYNDPVTGEAMYSLGLCMPLFVFDDILQNKILAYSYYRSLNGDKIQGADLTDILGIKKFDLPPIKNSMAKGLFPVFIKKTDQERIQNLITNIDFESDEKFEVTLKIDGTSATYYYRDGEIGFCSRNQEKKMESTCEQGMINAKYQILEKLKTLGRNIAIQGEIYGEGLQKNPEKIKGKDFAVFDIFDIDNFKYLSPTERVEICKQLEIPHIPIISIGSLKELDLLELQDILMLAINTPNTCGELSEGVVFKSMDRDFSFKAISNKYLTK